MRLVAVFLAACGLCAPLEYRVWQLHDDDPENVARTIKAASSYGVNRIQLSHQIVMNASDVLADEERAVRVNCYASWAHEAGLAVDIWTHELEAVPDEYKRNGRVRLDDPDTQEWLTSRYRALFEALPSVDGLVLTFHETDAPVYDDSRVESGLPPAARVGLLITLIADVCEERGKKLFVRTFAYEPEQLEFIGEALRATAADIVVMSKEVPHDWQPFYPPNPLLGAVGDHPQVVETDPGAEFYGQSRLWYCSPEYFARRINWALSEGCVGVVARVERGENHVLGTPNEVNLYAISRLWDGSGASPERIWREWATARYGRHAAPYAVEALSRTDEIVNLTFFPLGFWITDHSRLPSFSYAHGHITSRSTAKWTGSPEDERTERRLLAPDEATLDEIKAEKRRALLLVEEALAALERGERTFRDEDYEELRRGFEYARDVVRVFEAHNDAFFSCLAAEAAREGARRAGFEARARAACVRLVALAGLMERRWGADVWPGNPGRARALAREVEERLR